jgi:phytoene synthase
MRDELRFPNRATPPGSRSYYCVRVAPQEQHDDLALLFLWRQELRDILYRCSDPGVAQAKLQWYRDEFCRALEDRAQQPLAQALAGVIQQHGLPEQPFHGMADALAADLHPTGHPDMAALKDYCRLDSGSLLELVTRVCGGTPQEADCARQLGAFVRLVEIIRGLGPDLERGHRHLPRAELERAGLPPGGRLKREQQQPLAALLAHMAAQARAWPADAKAALPGGKHPALIPARAQVAMAQALLTELEKSQFPVLEQRISLTPLRKLWIAWRSRRGFTI